MSLFAKYIWERQGDEILETDHGFATYCFLNEGKTVYIKDIFVDSDFRKTGAASNMANAIVEIAKKKGCSELLGTVVPSTKGSTTSLKVLLGYGMQLVNASNDLIVFKKEI